MLNAESKSLIEESFGHDMLMYITTFDGENPTVRIVNSYYKNGSFYTITHGLSKKMKQIAKNPSVTISGGEWFCATGIGENLGYVGDTQNADLMKQLRKVFSTWLDNGDTNEEDKNTCILRIKLKKGVFFYKGYLYDLVF